MVKIENLKKLAARCCAPTRLRRARSVRSTLARLRACALANNKLSIEASLRAKELSERPERSEGRERITRRGV